jgi:hypothetical protein
MRSDQRCIAYRDKKVVGVFVRFFIALNFKRNVMGCLGIEMDNIKTNYIGRLGEGWFWALRL